MKKLTLLLISFTTLMLIQASAYSYDYDQGVYDLNRGEFKAAMAQFTPLVAENYAPAQYQMGLIYLNGYSVLKDIPKAVELFTLSAAQNFPDAMFELSLMYSEGNKVIKKDKNKAFTLMEKAADKGLVRAQYNLGVMYYHGEGTTQDYYRASRFYQQAADKNYALAQFNLALMYFEGQGVEQSIEMSYVWNIIAAWNGYKIAEKSRDMDEYKLSAKQIKINRAKAESIYKRILKQRNLSYQNL